MIPIKKRCKFNLNWALHAWVFLSQELTVQIILCKRKRVFLELKSNLRTTIILKKILQLVRTKKGKSGYLSAQTIFRFAARLMFLCVWIVEHQNVWFKRCSQMLYVYLPNALDYRTECLSIAKCNFIWVKSARDKLIELDRKNLLGTT